jgi:hypothetical protein
MSDPRHPVRTETLATPAMQTPHESLNISVKRGVLAAVMGHPAEYPLPEARDGLSSFGTRASRNPRSTDVEMVPPSENR